MSGSVVRLAVSTRTSSHPADAEDRGVGRDAVPVRWRQGEGRAALRDGPGAAFDRMREASRSRLPDDRLLRVQAGGIGRRRRWHAASHRPAGRRCSRACSTPGFVDRRDLADADRARQRMIAIGHQRPRLVDRPRLSPALDRRRHHDPQGLRRRTQARAARGAADAPARQHRAGRPRPGVDRPRDGDLQPVREGPRARRLGDARPHGARADQPGARRDPRRAGGRVRRRHALGDRLVRAVRLWRVGVRDRGDPLEGEEHARSRASSRRGSSRRRAARVRLLARDEYTARLGPGQGRARSRLGGDAAPRPRPADRRRGVQRRDLLARLGGLGDTARDLAYRMYHVAERKGWTDEARAYNALVVAWTDLARGAESARARPSRRRRASGSSRGRRWR